ncbi:unnamed protein product [Lepeophtheirus salmonis]|uniref:(salmon louse) hypothetical protein n=1 Tax=Lepeophtheirus salmonis TaxID=72036 RepID=A0A7R8H9Q2_LEPSM|nr:unnamed protein product [Lepeophtheirus salmonis]CAF2945019.1 unnamed protein product [Lepeophtheirus salmonis]
MKGRIRRTELKQNRRVKKKKKIKKKKGLFSKESLFSRAGCGWNLNYCCTIYINGRGIRSRSAGAVGISAASTAIIGTSTGTVAAVVTQKINNAKSKS